MIKLTDWFLSRLEYDGECFYIVHGNVSGHPKLQDGIFINTSKIEKVTEDLDNNRLIMLTHSNNTYELTLATINFNNIEYTKQFLEVFDISASVLEPCKRLHDESEIKLLSEVDSILENNELFLKTFGVYTQRAFYKDDTGKVREILVRPHIGMFQDSYLITDWEDGKVDFRYFDKPNGIEPYHWSDGLKAVKIKNEGASDILFLADTSIACLRDKITVIESTSYNGEGLFSPDVVNGKSLLIKMEDIDVSEFYEED